MHVRIRLPSLTLAAACAALTISMGFFVSSAAYRPAACRSAAPLPAAVSASALSGKEPATHASADASAEAPSVRVIRLCRVRQDASQPPTDCLGIFEENSDTPLETWPVDLSALPDDAVARLRQGIRVFSQEEIVNCLEDFL